MIKETIFEKSDKLIYSLWKKILKTYSWYLVVKIYVQTNRIFWSVPQIFSGEVNYNKEIHSNFRNIDSKK